MRRLACYIFILALSGCALVRQQQMEKSLQAYKDCLVSNESNVEACEGLRLSYLADMEAYKATNGALLGIGEGRALSFQPPPAEQPRTWMQNMGGSTLLCNNFGGTVNCN